MSTVQKVEKKEGARMTCKSCGSNLVCHEKIYPATDQFAEKKTMQWQNTDGSPHYKTNDGKNFECKIPQKEDQNIILQAMNNKIDQIMVHFNIKP